MNLQFDGTDDGFEFRVRVSWKPFFVFLKTLLVLGSVITVVSASPLGTKVHALLQAILSQLP